MFIYCSIKTLNLFFIVKFNSSFMLLIRYWFLYWIELKSIFINKDYIIILKGDYLLKFIESYIFKEFTLIIFKLIFLIIIN